MATTTMRADAMSSLSQLRVVAVAELMVDRGLVRIIPLKNYDALVTAG